MTVVLIDSIGLYPELIEADNVLIMQTTRVTRSSVLGKRSHPQEPSLPAVCEQQLQTPESTPSLKRVRTVSNLVDGDANKENVPPELELVHTEVSTPRSTRSRKRTDLVTPVRSRTATKPHPSPSAITSPATPVNEIGKLAITPPPTPPIALLPLHTRARALLRSTCNSTAAQIAGRDSERATIFNFLTSFLCDPDVASDASPSTCLYISGSPGTGKTALVNSALQDIATDVKVVFVNCMALKSIESLWERLIEDLNVGRRSKSSGRSKKSKGRDAVEALLSHHIKCIIVLDELDHITPTTQSLASLFSLPDSTPSTVRLIGIANTHTLTSSFASTSSVTAASNVRTLHFAPYTPSQLQQILQSRLQPLYVDADDDEGKSAVAAKKFLPPPTLMLLTKKIAAMTGDVRSVFEVLRGAIDLAVTAASSSDKNDNPLNTPLPAVTPAHVLAALKAYSPSSTSTPSTKTPVAVTATSVAPATTNSEIVAKVNGLGLQARLVLLSILLASKRLETNLSIITTSVTSTPRKTPASPTKRSTSSLDPKTNVNGTGLDPTQLYTYYSTVLERSDSGVFEPVSRSEFNDLLGILEGVGLATSGATSSATTGTGAKRTFGRSTSFVGGSGLSGANKGRGELKLANGVRSDEVLRGLGIMAAELDVMEEEVKAIWERENARLLRDLKAIEREKERAAFIANGFEGAQED
ncbi:hypothetical protein C0992_012301 [Termitomyces sp. T32_za158]|nr:hypothetical protein C0992_012301 [Termitomyces sp. T32_za158]